MSRLLVIDDEHEVCALLQKVLERSGHEVRTALSGEEGLAVLEGGWPVELLLVDKNLPRMHGAEVIERAKALMPALKVILITAHPEPFAVPPERLDGYLAKPFKSLAAVDAAVSQALEGPSALAGLRRWGQVVSELSPLPKKRA